MITPTMILAITTALLAVALLLALALAALKSRRLERAVMINRVLAGGEWGAIPLSITPDGTMKCLETNGDCPGNPLDFSSRRMRLKDAVIAISDHHHHYHGTEKR